jgi:hypothetical protein
MRDFLIDILVPVFGFFVIPLGLMLLGIYGLMVWECNAKTSGIGYAKRFSVMGGCQIHVDGRWLPLENYRGFEATP